MEFIEPDSRRVVRNVLAGAREASRRRYEEVTQAATRAAEALIPLQDADGYWCGELTGDSTLESDYVLLQLWMYPPDESGAWNPPTRGRLEKACRQILKNQLPDGGWSIYKPGPSELNATVRAYTALKLCGFDIASPEMSKARECALALGGLQACNSYTKINFSFFDLFPRRYVPSVPPEIAIAPGDVLYEMSSWTRTIIIPLSIVQALGQVKATPHGMRVDELLAPRKRFTLPKLDTAAIVFRHVDKAIKLWEKRGLKNVRAKAIREAERWMLERTRYTDGLGAIYPSMMYTIMALQSLGYADDQPDLIEAMRHFDNLILETETRFQFQPAVSPIWDTAICAYALGETKLGPSAEALTKAADWLLSKEIRRKGDWSVKRPVLTPSGWAFEFANEFYPDIDDTAMVLIALRHAKATNPEKQRAAEARAVEWILGMQSADGGWAAFDVDNNWQLLNKVPFADHNAMLDPSCPDITGRVIDALLRCGLPRDHAAIQKGVRYLLSTQERDGSWFGRWGVNYIYGTFLAMRALGAAAPYEARPSIEKAAQFLRRVQNADGGWGESCASYRSRCFAAMASTPSQTAWALLGLAAAGDVSSECVHRGVDFLTGTQQADGRWIEELTTGTGFPEVFYISFGLYKDYFPLLALATLRERWGSSSR
ncbi:MAG TPA: squalene--hopene cyclase [Bryobacteraceae bacterium]|nr:squalene--hopene cyclase [Bryobacteraceae bacterium]